MGRLGRGAMNASRSFVYFMVIEWIMMSSVIIHKLKEWVEITPLISKIKKQAAIARQNKMKKILEDPKKIRSAAQGAVRRQQKLAGVK